MGTAFVAVQPNPQQCQSSALQRNHEGKSTEQSPFLLWCPAVCPLPVWDCPPAERHLIIPRMLRHALSRHLLVPEDCVSVTSGQLDAALLEGGRGERPSVCHKRAAAQGAFMRKH